MNMLATARRLLADTSHIVTETGERIPTPPSTDFTRGSDRLAELMNNLRQSSEVDAADIATNIANAARINTMNDERTVSASESLSEQMVNYAAALNNTISKIEDDQKIADNAHSDAIAALKEEIANRETAHSELTKANDERIADHRRALAGIDALQVTINPPTKPTNVARIGKGRAETVSGERE